MKRKIAMLSALGVMLGGLIWWGFAGSRSALVVTEVCEAATAREYERAVALADDAVVDVDRTTYNECLCASLVALDRAEDCAVLIDANASPVPALPSVADALYGVYTRQRNQARITEAARAAVESIDNPSWEWIRRAMVADATIDKEHWRVQARRSSNIAVSIANVARSAADEQFASEVVGETPPSSADEYTRWRVERAMLFGALNDDAGGLKHLQESVVRGTPRSVAEAEFAVGVAAGMRLTDRSQQALAFAWSHRDELPLELREVVASRYVQVLTVIADHETLTKVVDLCLAEGIPSSLGPAQARSLDVKNQERFGTLKITADIDGFILISPDGKSAVNMPYDRLPVKANEAIAIQRTVSDHPVRYVLHDLEGRVRGAAQGWLIPENIQTLSIAADEPWSSSATLPLPRVADGTRRVVTIVVDSGDWRYLQYGFATRQLPMLKRLVEGGPSGVLISDPPSTAMAMQKLMEPSPLPKDMPLRVRRLGSQYQVAVGLMENPVGGLNLFSQSARPSLIDVIGAKKRVLNMLFSHGIIKAGAVGIVGPEGSSPISLTGRRSLTDSDTLRVASFSESLVYQDQFESAAAQLDDLVKLIGQHAADLYLYRYDPTDVLAHTHLPSWSNVGSIKQNSLFFDSYLYFDLRLRDIVAAVDADDVVLIVSDHGTQNSSNHDRRGLFIVSASGMSAASIAGVRIEHVAGYIATLLCIDDPWRASLPMAALSLDCPPDE